MLDTDLLRERNVPGVCGLAVLVCRSVFEHPDEEGLRGPSAGAFQSLEGNGTSSSMYLWPPGKRSGM